MMSTSSASPSRNLFWTPIFPPVGHICAKVKERIHGSVNNSALPSRNTHTCVCVWMCVCTTHVPNGGCNFSPQSYSIIDSSRLSFLQHRDLSLSHCTASTCSNIHAYTYSCLANMQHSTVPSSVHKVQKKGSCQRLALYVIPEL